MNSMTHRSSVAALAVLALLALGACSGSSKSSSAEATTTTTTAAADLYTASAADLEALTSDQPLTAPRATLYVNGLSCPLCATNIDLQLKRVRGVDSASVDLSTGKVVIQMPGKTKPSPKRLAGAVDDAGATLVRIEQE